MAKWGYSWYGLLQAFADALKLLLKEYVSPTQANIVLFFLGPIITLIFSLLGYAVIPWLTEGITGSISPVLIEKLLLCICILVFLFISMRYKASSQNVFLNSTTLLTIVVLVFMLFNSYLDLLYCNEASLVLCSGIYPITSLSKDSNHILTRNMTDSEFNPWFTGFIDGEGYFYISMTQNSVIGFRFGIHLHLDDIETLEFIKDKLNCGIISTNHTSGSAKFELNNLNDIRTKLIPLLDNFPLNGVKYLDYLAFREGIIIKLNEGLLKHKNMS